MRFPWLVFLSLVFIFNSCRPGETFSPGFALQIKVVNFNNQPIEGATVILYADQESFINDRQVIAPKQTDRNGQVTFTGLPFGTLGYYASVERGSANNWSDPLNASIYFNTRDLEYSRTIRITESSIQNALAGRFSRRWRRVSYNLNGTVNTSCAFTQVHEFRRDSFIHIFNSQGCPNAGQQVGSIVWAVAPDNRGLIFGAATTGRQISITDLTATTLRTTETPQAGLIIIEEYQLIQ